MSTCQACSAPILWARTATGRSIPLDAAPNLSGNVLYRPIARSAEVLSAVAARTAREQGEHLYMPHHATCPNAVDFRRPR